MIVIKKDSIIKTVKDENRKIKKWIVKYVNGETEIFDAEEHYHPFNLLVKNFKYYDTNIDYDVDYIYHDDADIVIINGDKIVYKQELTNTFEDNNFKLVENDNLKTIHRKFMENR